MEQANNNAATAATAVTTAPAAVAIPPTEVAVAPIEFFVKKAIKFHFKKDELGSKRPSIELELPFLTLSGVAKIINARPSAPAPAEGEEPSELYKKQLLAITQQQDLLLSALDDVVVVQAREQVNAKLDITQETLDNDKLSWAAIAAIPKSERRGAGIPKEVWEAFAADYISIMPGLIGRDVEKVTNAATILTKRFQPVKTVKAVIAQLKDYLDIWFANTANADDLAEVYEFLTKKAEELLAADEAKLLENI